MHPPLHARFSYSCSFFFFSSIEKKSCSYSSIDEYYEKKNSSKRGGTKLILDGLLIHSRKVEL